VNGAPLSSRLSGADQALALSLAVAIRTGSYYDADNAVMQQVCSTLSAQLADRTADEGFVRIGVHSHSVFVGGSRVRATVATYERFASLTQLFENWGINTLTFHAGVSDSDLLGLMLVLGREHGNGPDELSTFFRGRGVTHVDVDLFAPGSAAQAVAPVEAYAAAVQIGEELRERTESGTPANVRQVRHVTQAVVDQIMSDPRALIALTTIKEFDSYLISHSTNVAILSVLLGQRLGLSKSRLGELCLAAFLHDAGQLVVASEVLKKPGPLTQEEWDTIRMHPISAARTLLGGRRLSSPSMRAVVVAFEHHLNYDLSGYPTPKIRDHVSLFGNIVAIVDRYDALTTARPYRETNLTPHEALSHLMAHSGTHFDPALVKLFVEIMGLYPPGTLVDLSSGDLGVACEPPVVGRPLDRPKVRLLTGEHVGEVVDLDEQTDGHYTLNVTRVVNPSNRGQMPAVDMSVFEIE
jgi:HD-GYP domain-containing protein (c-di-GMP phosphodiesterase class II)